jgi:thiamine biosynthesis protein ThiI
MKFVVKLFPEITIKSKPVRQRLVRQLRQNINETLKREFGKIAVESFWDKIEVSLRPEQLPLQQAVADTLQRIPGIANILQVQSHQIDGIDHNFARIAELVVQAFRDVVAGRSFEVRVKRAGVHGFRSLDLERYLGGALLDHGAARVELNRPEVTVNVEVRDQTVYLVERRFEGLGGYPIGSQDEVLSLISGGFDSGVASYLTMKRGLKTHFCFFNLGGAAHEVGVKQVALYLWEKFGVSHRVRFVTVPFEEVLADILKHVDHGHMGVVLKRMMLRAATRIAAELKIEALVTGESVAQVSSQTLANLSVIDQVTGMLVLRPLITLDKQDIIHQARRIGTEEFARNMPEYCGVISDRPNTRTRLARVEHEEARLDFGILDRAIEQCEIIKIDRVLTSRQSQTDVVLVGIPDVSDVIVDIRHPDEIEKSPLFLTNNEVLRIPFYELPGHLAGLAADRRYLLYCEQGTMSQLHAAHLAGQHDLRVGVYLPE